MLNFENLDGFVIDLTTKELCDEILDDILCGDKALYDFVILYPLQYKREFIVDYFTDTYKYVFCKSAYVYQICECELRTDDEVELLRKKVAQGFQYAVEIEDLKENINELEYRNEILVGRLDEAESISNELFKENTILKEKLQKINVILEDKE